MKNTRYFVLAALIVGAVLLRFAALPPNFSPIAAVALFAGALFIRQRWLAVCVPLAAMLLSDLVIGFHGVQIFVYASYVLIALLGRGLIDYKKDEQPNWLGVGASSLSASAIFFLISNFGVWFEGMLYPRTGAGLAECYFAAVPFFWNTLTGDLVFTFGLFGAWALVLKAAPQLRVASGR